MLVSRKISDFCFSHDFKAEEQAIAKRVRKGWLYGYHVAYKDIATIENRRLEKSSTKHS